MTEKITPDFVKEKYYLTEIDNKNRIIATLNARVFMQSEMIKKLKNKKAKSAKK